MKKLASLLIFTVMLAVPGVMGQRGCPHNDCNPKKDPDIQRKYDEHQKEHNEKKQRDEKKKQQEKDEKNGKVPCCEVKISGDTPHKPPK